MRIKGENRIKTAFLRIKSYFYVIISIILIISLIRNISRIRRAEDRIDNARERVENLEERRKELEANLERSQSELYLEKQLRDGLGLAKEEDIVIVLPDEEVLRRIAPDLDEQTEKEEIIPNWKKWLSLFITVED